MTGLPSIVSDRFSKTGSGECSDHFGKQGSHRVSGGRRAFGRSGGGRELVLIGRTFDKGDGHLISKVSRSRRGDRTGRAMEENLSISLKDEHDEVRIALLSIIDCDQVSFS